MTHHTWKSASGLLILAAFMLGASRVHAVPLVVTTGKVEGTIGKEVVVPISIKDVKEAKAISAMSIQLNYDPNVLTFKSVANFSRVETYGSPFMGWVKGVVDTNDREVFRFSPRLYSPIQ